MAKSYTLLIISSCIAAAEAFSASVPALRGGIRARGGESACAAQSGESVVSRRGFAFGLVGAAVLLPTAVFAEEAKGGEAASDAPKSDGGVKECDTPATPKPKGEEVCAADY
ncbi:hypothetical protein T484DRAFT_1966280 [Baffinella frigidus]|nr:hypothetical protein T484DRAFT_1966280 [Cryptophyta sp. CCMP2293]